MNFGVVKITKIDAPDARSLATCARTSGAVTSCDSAATMFDAFAPRPFLRPSRFSLPKSSFWYRTAIFAFGLLWAIAWP